MTRRRRAANQILTGLDDVDALLKEMKISSGNRAARSGLTAACRLGVKLVKQKIPSTKKTIKNAIGYRVRMDKKTGSTKAKFGASVGKKQAPLAKRGKRRGVGIGSRNIHWWVMGTQDRTLSSGSASGPPAGHPTGEMPATPVISDIWATNKSQIESTLRQKTKEAIVREWVSGRARK